jgi:hypothetical protein
MRERQSLGCKGYQLVLLLPLFTMLACGGSIDALPEEGRVTADAASSMDAAPTDSTSALPQDAAAAETNAPPPDDALCFVKAAADCVDCCIQCCGSNHPAGNQSFISIEQSCVCAAGSPCAEPCAYEFCINSGPGLGDKCDVCLNAEIAGPCGAVLDAGCSADPACSGYVACTNGCALAATPPPIQDAGAPDTGCGSACEDAETDLDAGGPDFPPYCTQGSACDASIVHTCDAGMGCTQVCACIGGTQMCNIGCP